MFDFDAIKSAKIKTKTNHDENESKSEELLTLALKSLEDFHKFAPSKENLKDVAKKFIEVIKYKRNRVEPYVYLAYIHYLLGNDKIAFRYIKSAESIDKNYSKINIIKEMLVHS